MTQFALGPIVILGPNRVLNLGGSLELGNRAGLVELVYSRQQSGASKCFIGMDLICYLYSNTAYESGNVSGALLGLTPFFQLNS